MTSFFNSHTPLRPSGDIFFFHDNFSVHKDGGTRKGGDSLCGIHLLVSSSPGACAYFPGNHFSPGHRFRLNGPDERVLCRRFEPIMPRRIFNKLELSLLRGTDRSFKVSEKARDTALSVKE